MGRNLHSAPRAGDSGCARSKAGQHTAQMYGEAWLGKVCAADPDGPPGDSTSSNSSAAPAWPRSGRSRAPAPKHTLLSGSLMLG